MNPEIKGRLISFISKKFVFALMVFLVSTILLLAGHLNGTGFTAILTGEAVAFNFGDMAEKYENYADKAGVGSHEQDS